MAIQKKISKEENEYKFNFNDAYFKIDDLYIDAINEKIRIGLRGYANPESRKTEGIGIYKKIFEVDFSKIKIDNFSKDSILRTCYTYLMSLDEFKESVKI